MKEKLPRIGMMTNPSEEIVHGIKKAHKLGMDYVELGIEPYEETYESLMKKKNIIIEALKALRYPAIQHTTWWADIGSPYENVRKVWIKEIKKLILIASKLRIEKFNLHVHAKGVLNKKKHQQIVLENSIKSLKELVGFAKKYNIKIILENAPYKWSNFENFRYIVDRVPGLYVHLDLGHIFITDGMEGFKKFIPFFSSKLEHIHIHDNYGKEDDHLPLGKGKIDFLTVIKELKKIKYEKTITFEVFSDKGLLDSISFFRRLWLK